MPETITFLNTTFSATVPQELLPAIDKASTKTPLRIATLNAVFFLDALTQPDFRQALTAMTHCTIDGSGPAYFLALWRFLQRKPAITRYAGADLAADLFEHYQDGSKRFFLLGGAPGLAEQAAKTLRKKYPRIQIETEEGGVINRDKVIIEPRVIQKITTARTDILLVAFGEPKQELWIQAAASLPIPVMIGVGGTFKFYANRSRAPKALRLIGLEWLFRWFHEPGHSKRVWRSVIVFSCYALGWIIKTSLLRGNVRR